MTDFERLGQLSMSVYDFITMKMYNEDDYRKGLELLNILEEITKLANFPNMERNLIIINAFRTHINDNLLNK